MLTDLFFVVKNNSMSRLENKCILYYIHDPMCSWCWGFVDVLSRLKMELPKSVQFKSILGGLADDSDLPMPEKMQAAISNTWLTIQETIPGVVFNYDFWKLNQPRRSTYPACRAVIAARIQAPDYDERMTRIIQDAYYKQARNPSDYKVLIQLADEIGLDAKRFENDILSSIVEDELMSEISFSRQMNVNSFPSLILYFNDQYLTLPHDYLHENSMLDVIHSIINRK